MGEIKRRI